MRALSSPRRPPTIKLKSLNELIDCIIFLFESSTSSTFQLSYSMTSMSGTEILGENDDSLRSKLITIGPLTPLTPLTSFLSF